MSQKQSNIGLRNYLFGHADWKEEVSIRPFYSPLIFTEKKINFEVKSLSLINNWNLHLCYLGLLRLNDMKCSYSTPTIGCIFNALTLS